MFHGNFHSQTLLGIGCGSCFYHAVVIRHALNSHHSIHLGFQADSPYFVPLVSKYQTGDWRAFLHCQPQISLKESHKVCGSGESGLFCLKVDFDFVTFVKLVSVAFRNPHAFVLQTSDTSFEKSQLTPGLFTVLEEKQSRRKTAASRHTLVSAMLQHEGERRMAQKVFPVRIASPTPRSQQLLFW